MLKDSLQGDMPRRCLDKKTQRSPEAHGKVVGTWHSSHILDILEDLF